MNPIVWLSLGLIAVLFAGMVIIRSLHGKTPSVSSADVLSLLAESLVMVIEQRSFSRLLSGINRYFNGSLVLLAVLDRNRLMDLEFYSADETDRISLPRMNRGDTLLSESIMERLEVLSELRIEVVADSPRSLFSDVRARNLIRIGFLYRGRMIAVMEILGDNLDARKISGKDFENSYQILHSLFLGYHLDRLHQEHHHKISQRLLRLEDRYASIFDDSKDLIYHADADGILLAVNRAGVMLLGYSSEEEMVGRNMVDFYLDGGQREFYLDLIRSNSVLKDMEVVLETKDKRKVYCLENSSASFDGTGKVKSYTGIIKDITDRINLDRELWRTNMELQESNRRLQDTQSQMIQSEKLASIGQLAAGIAHEINNPLGFVRSNFSSIRRYCDNLLDFAGEVECENSAELWRKYQIDFIRDDLDPVFRETEEGMSRMMEIVQNLRTFSHSDLPGEMQSVDFNDMVRNTLVIARNEIKYHAAVELDLGKLPPLNCSPGQIKQVLLNMVVNAAQAIKGAQKEGEKGKIRVRTRLANDMIRCTLDDSGPGIPEEIRHQIFDPFFSTKEVGAGTGLGLSISYDIVVNKHGGRIYSSKSELGGASFVFELPLAAAEEMEEVFPSIE